MEISLNEGVSENNAGFETQISLRCLSSLFYSIFTTSISGSAFLLSLFMLLVFGLV